MQLLDLRFYIKNKFWLGFFALVASVIAWTAEFTGIVYVCPYCQVQRTIIGLLGVVLMTPLSRIGISQFFSTVIGFFGAVVAANQQFLAWKKISDGTFSFKDNLVIDPFILSGLAMTFILFQLLVLNNNLLKKQKV